MSLLDRFRKILSKEEEVQISREEQNPNIKTPLDALETIRRATNNEVNIIGMGIPSKSVWERARGMQRSARAAEGANTSPKKTGKILDRIDDCGNPELKDGFEKYLSKLKKNTSLEFLFHPRTLSIIKGNQSVLNITAGNSEYIVLVHTTIDSAKLLTISTIFPDATYVDGKLRVIIREPGQITYLMKDILP